MDIIYLHGIAVNCAIGVDAWEKQLTRRLVLDIDMRVDVQQAAARDSFDEALNYSEVFARIKKMTRESSYNLIESMAEGIAQMLLGEFELPWVRVRVRKPGALGGVSDVGVVIERGAPGKKTAHTAQA